MNSKAKEVLSTSLYFLFVIVVCFLVVKYVAQRTEVIGVSMMETLHDGDNLIMNKISYRLGEPERFDIVIFPFRNDERKNYIKRIIGLPGETIQIDDHGNIFINGELLEEHYGKDVIENPGRAAEPFVLGDDEYFVMGDNRNNSEDSRFYEVGPVHRDEILGKVWIRIFPLNRFGKVDK